MMFTFVIVYNVMFLESNAGGRYRLDITVSSSTVLFHMSRSTSQVDSQPHRDGSHAQKANQASSSIAGSSHSPSMLGPWPASPITSGPVSGFLAGSNNSNVDHSVLTDIAGDQINFNVEIGTNRTVTNYGTKQDNGIFTPIDSVRI
jgi:hypothetical protein